jgi:oligosaccharide repeat unit polymerase
MWIEWILMSLNTCLLIMISARLQLHKTGIFSVGFFNLYTAIFPHYILFPFYLLVVGDSMIQSAKFIPGLMLISLMLASLFTGTLLTTKKTAPLQEKMVERNLRLPRLLLLFLISLSLLLGVNYTLYEIVNPFALLEKARTIEIREIYLQHNLAAYFYLFITGVIFFLLALIISNIYKKGRNFRSFLMSLFVAAFTAVMMLSFGSRNQFFMPLIIFLFLTDHYYKKVNRLFIMGSFLLFIPIFVFIRWLGGGHDPVFLYHQYAADLGFIMNEFIGRFHSFKGLVDFLEWFGNKDFVYGITVLQSVVRPIPRFLWPNKPSSFDVFLSREIYGSEIGGITLFGGLAELYYNYWILGVAVWFFFLGTLLYKFHFGCAKLLRDRKYIVAAMIISNYGILRGLGTLGLSTSNTQQLLMNIASQLVVLVIINGLFALLDGWKPARARFAGRPH